MTYRVDQETYNATNYVALRATIPNGLLASITVEGYHIAGDGGGGVFHWDTTSSTGDDGGTIIVPTGSTTGRWKRIFDNAINVKWWGAYGDNSHDDTAAINAACQYIKPGAGTNNGNNVFVPTGYYLMSVPAPNSAALYVTHNIQLIGEGGGGFAGGGGSWFHITGFPVNVNITHATNANPTVITTSTNHQLGTLRYIVHITGVVGNTRVNGYFPAAYIDQNHFSIPVDTTSDPAYSSGGTVKYGSGSGISVESNLSNGAATTSFGSMFSNIGIQANNVFLSGGVDNGVQDLWVFHAPYITIRDCHAVGATRYGCIIDSGTTDGYGIVSASLAPSNTYIFGDQCNIYGLDTYGCGAGNEININGSPDFGGGTYIHGSDGGGALFQKCNSFSNNVGFMDVSLLGNTYIECASQASSLGFYNASGGSTIFLNCTSEDIVTISPTGTNMVIGGSILNPALSQGTAVVGPQSNIVFASPGNEGGGVQYNGNIAHGSVFQITRLKDPTNTQVYSDWNLQYNAFSHQYPYGINSYLFRHTTTGFLDNCLDGTIFGWTEIWNSRGSGQFIIASPLMNSQQRWSFVQNNVALSDGYNIVYINGNPNVPVTFLSDPSINQNSLGNSGISVSNNSPLVNGVFTYNVTPGMNVQFGSQPGVSYEISSISVLATGEAANGQVTLTTNYTGTTNANTSMLCRFWNFAKTRISADIQYQNLSDMQSNCYFSGYMFTGSGSNRNCAVNIVNPTSSIITVNLVWHFEAFTQNYNTGSGNIG